MQSPVATPLTKKLMRLVPLSAADAAVLDGLQLPTQAVPRHRELISTGRRYDGLLILLEGLAIRSRVLHDGRRQILNIAIPGDVIGFPACFFETALYSVTALTDALVSSVAFARLLALFNRPYAPAGHPQQYWSITRILLGCRPIRHGC